MTAEVITYRLRSAMRDVGKALGVPEEEVDRLAKQVELPPVRSTGETKKGRRRSPAAPIVGDRGGEAARGFSP